MHSKERTGGREREEEGGMEEGWRKEEERRKPLPAWGHVGKGLDDEGPAGRG